MHFKKNKTNPPQKFKIQSITKHGLIHVGKESREEKVQLQTSEENRDNQHSYGIASFDQHCCLSSKNFLSNLFSQYKISLC